MRATLSVITLSLLLSLGGCAVVDATADVVGAAGNLVGATAHATASAVHTAARAAGGSGQKNKPQPGTATCPADGSSPDANCQPAPQSPPPQQ